MSRPVYRTWRCSRSASGGQAGAAGDGGLAGPRAQAPGKAGRSRRLGADRAPEPQQEAAHRSRRGGGDPVEGPHAQGTPSPGPPHRAAAKPLLSDPSQGPAGDRSSASRPSRSVMAKPRGCGPVGESPGNRAPILARPSGSASRRVIVYQSARLDPLSVTFAEGAQPGGRFIRVGRPSGAEDLEGSNQLGADASSFGPCEMRMPPITLPSVAALTAAIPSITSVKTGL